MHRKRITELGILRALIRIDKKLNLIDLELHQVLTFMTTPIKLTQNEKLILMSLPSHLCRTFFTLDSIGTATATQVSTITGKKRAVESNYLNQLTTMGYINKHRKHQIALFTIRGQTCPKTRDNT